VNYLSTFSCFPGLGRSGLRHLSINVESLVESEAQHGALGPLQPIDS
jgi:hypothetical protein